MHGIGIQQTVDGKTYSGEFKNKEKEGKGIYIWVDERAFNGQW